ncbi:MAG: AIPR family protein, partial [Pseudomonadota bacterium]
IIDGLQLKEWWDAHGKRIVAKNIRHALGATEINEAIRKTATSSPEDFWYFNNGITLIAQDVVRAPKGAASHSIGAFEFRDVSVVNGAQTISTLARVTPEESLGRVRVGIRVIVLAKAPPDFGVDVTRTNNLQNRVEGRDFAAHDPEQTRLQQEMSMEGVEYQFLRGAEFVSSPTACELIEVTTALACAAADPNLAVTVKTGIGRFFNDLSKAPYKAVFNASVSGAKAFNATLCLRTIEAWLEKKKETVGKRSGYPWGALVHGNRILASAVFKMVGPREFERPIEEFRGKLDSFKIDEKCDSVYAGMLEALQTDYPDKVLSVLFKSPVRSKAVFDRAVAKAAQAQTQPANDGA